MDVDKKVIAIDIETLALTKDYRELENEGSILNWEKYCDTYKNEDFKRISVSDNIDFYQVIWEKMSALNPIYSKILCLSMGFYYDGEYRSKTLYGDEKKIISDFFKLTQKFFVDGNYKILAGHNIKQFDIPFILKRALANGFSYSEFPFMYQIGSKKPWELEYIKDTKEMVNFGGSFFKTSLSELCLMLNLPNPKEGISGADIYNFIYNNEDVSYEEKMEKICKYCEGDVKSVLDVLKYIG
jgi:DNA polymerase elongation subunit (family B)